MLFYYVLLQNQGALSHLNIVLKFDMEFYLLFPSFL